MATSGLGLHHDKEGRGGRIDDLDQSGADFVSAESRQVIKDHLPFGVSLFMAGIHRDIENGVSVHEADGVTDGGEGGFPQGGDGFIPAGEPAQVEHPRAEGHVHVLFDVGMGIQDELVVIGASALDQVLLGGGQGLLLDIKGVDEAVGAHGFGEELGIVAVAHGEIHRHVAGAKVLEDEVFVEFE